MTNSKTSFFVCMAMAAAALLAVVGMAVRPGGRDEGRAVVPVPKSPERVAMGPPVTGAERRVAVTEAVKATPEVVAETIAPLPVDATTVPDETLLKLAGMVGLANARFHPPDKERWKQAIPIAQRLLAGPCDCEQRNWLKHFVAMGNDALADAEAEYNADALAMASLGRNDNDAMAISHRPR